MTKKKAKCTKKEKSKKLDDSIMDINLLNNDEEYNQKIISDFKMINYMKFIF